MDVPLAREIANALAAPFPADCVRWKPGNVSGSRCLALAHIDARTVMDRLDAVLGVDGWEDSYTLLPDGNVQCTLRVHVNGSWVSKVDVAGSSKQPDAGDKLKAAYSGALKRAAAKVGVGRYLYRLGRDWCEYDPAKKRIITPPRLPAWALPAGGVAPSPAPAPAPALPAVSPLAPPAPSPGCILPEQATLLNGMLRRLDVQPEHFCRFLGVPAIADLPSRLFEVVRLVLATEADPKRFLQFFEVSSVAKLTDEKIQRAITVLRDKKTRQEEEEARSGESPY